MSLNNQDYKYSYKGLVVWILLFCLSYVIAMFLPLDEKYLTLIVLCITAWDIVLLMYMMYRNEYIYWFNGIGYDEAKQAGSIRRKEYAYAHLIRFLKVSIGYTILTIIMMIFHIPYFVNIIVFVVGMAVTAIMTFNIKL